MQFKSTGVVEFSHKVYHRRNNSHSILNYHNDSDDRSLPFVITYPQSAANEPSWDAENPCPVIDETAAPQKLAKDQQFDFAEQAPTGLGMARLCLFGLGLLTMTILVLRYLSF